MVSSETTAPRSIPGASAARPPSRVSDVVTRLRDEPWARLALATIAVGVAAGLGALALVLVVHSVEDLVWGHASGPFLDNRAYPSNRWLPLVVLSAAGVGLSLAWYALRRWGTPLVSIKDSMRGTRMPVVGTTLDALIQVVGVALGSPIGKEVAPRQLAAMLADRVAALLGVDRRWVAPLIASAAGAGLAAVYNVPLAGTLFALEILLARVNLRLAGVALTVNVIATLVARPLVPDTSLYTVPEATSTWWVIAVALAIGPILGWIGASFTLLMRRLTKDRPTGWRLLLWLPLTLAAVGLLAVWFPLLLGNGRAIAQVAFDGSGPIALLLALAVLKYLVTSATLGAGAIGGTLQPSIAIGAALGAAIGLWLGWDQPQVTALAIVGAAGFLATTMRAPLTAMALVLEFTDTGFTLLVPVTVCVVAALGTAELIDGLSHRRRARARLQAEA